jgi:hypothetical protein
MEIHEPEIRDQRERPDSITQRCLTRKNLTFFCSLLLILITSGLVISNKLDLKSAVNATTSEAQNLLALMQLVKNTLYESAPPIQNQRP